MLEAMLWFGVSIFAIIMLIYTAVQGRKNAKNEAERMGERLNNLKNEAERMGERLNNLKNDDVNLQKTEKQAIKYCPDCSGKLDHDGRVYVCEMCGATYSEKEI